MFRAISRNGPITRFMARASRLRQLRQNPAPPKFRSSRMVVPEFPHRARATALHPRSPRRITRTVLSVLTSAPRALMHANVLWQSAAEENAAVVVPGPSGEHRVSMETTSPGSPVRRQNASRVEGPILLTQRF